MKYLESLERDERLPNPLDLFRHSPATLDSIFSQTFEPYKIFVSLFDRLPSPDPRYALLCGVGARPHGVVTLKHLYETPGMYNDTKWVTLVDAENGAFTIAHDSSLKDNEYSYTGNHNVLAASDFTQLLSELTLDDPDRTCLKPVLEKLLTNIGTERPIDKNNDTVPDESEEDRLQICQDALRKLRIFGEFAMTHKFYLLTHTPGGLEMIYARTTSQRIITGPNDSSPTFLPPDMFQFVRYITSDKSTYITEFTKGRPEQFTRDGVDATDGDMHKKFLAKINTLLASIHIGQQFN